MINSKNQQSNVFILLLCFRRIIIRIVIRFVDQKIKYKKMVSQEVKGSDYFGKYQQIFSFLSFQFPFICLYVGSFHMFYSIFTFNIPVILFYGILVIVQTRVRRNQRYIDFINKFFKPNKCIKEIKTIYQEEISEDEKCLYGLHPHGIFTPSTMILMNSDQGAISKMQTLASREMFMAPFTGLIMRLLGYHRVNSASMKKLMRQSTNISVLPGGFQEATITTPDELRIFIKQRKGFIKYALQYNYTIYPTLFLNEHKLFSTLPYFIRFRLWLNKLKLPTVFYFNPKYLWLIPTDVSYVTVVGRGIRGRHFQEGQQPSQEQIDQMHAKYIQQIKRIHQKHKEESKVPLKIY